MLSDPIRPCWSYMLFFFFFFSSRRRHTRWPRDWSSDVCSSDLVAHVRAGPQDDGGPVRRQLAHGLVHRRGDLVGVPAEIGRASCRERVEVAEEAACWEEEDRN